MSVSEREENTSESECETGDDTVTTDRDSGSEDDDYGNTEEERNEVEDVEPEEWNSTEFKVAKKRSRRFGETRWVERHTAFQDFEELYEALLLCLETNGKDKSRKKWDVKSKTEAQGLFHQ